MTWHEQKHFKIHIPLLLILATGVLIYEIALFASALQQPSDQAGVFFGKQLVVEQVRPESPLEVGDVILKIDEYDVTENLITPFKWQHQLDTASDQGAMYTILRDGETYSIDVPWQNYTVGHLIQRGGALWIFGLTTIVSVLILVSVQGHDRGARLVSTAFILIALNQINNIIRAIGANVALARAWFALPIDAIAIWLAFSGMLHAILVFPEVKSVLRRHPRLPWLIHLITPAISISAGLLMGGQSLLETRSAMFTAANPLMLAQGILSIVALSHTYVTNRRPGVRNQIRWITWGLCIAIAPWAIFHVTPSLLFHTTWLPLSLINLPLIMVPISFMVAIFRLGLMDVDRLINRTLVYGLVGGALAIVYLVVVMLTRDLTTSINGQTNHFLAGVVGALVVFVIFNPVRKSIQYTVNRTFYQQQLDFNQILRNMGRQLSTTMKLDDAYSLLTQDISKRLGLANAYILLPDRAKNAYSDKSGVVQIDADSPLIPWLTARNDPLYLYERRRIPPDIDTAAMPLTAAGGEICLPLMQHNSLLGLYLFGSKFSGNLLTRDEVNNLVLLGHQAAAAIQNARLYAELQEYNRSLEARVAARTSELQTERNRLDTIIQNVADGLVVTEGKGYIVSANAVFCEMVRLPIDLLLGIPLTDVLPSKGLHALVEAAFSTPGQVQTENISGDISITGGSARRTYKASACALIQRTLSGTESYTAVDGSVSGVVTVLRDITHEQEVDRMKTDFISMVSHELRTPLTSVLGFTKLIRRTFDREIKPRVDNDDQRGQRAVTRVSDNLEIISSEGDRLTRLINDVLDIAKMEAGKTEWHMTDVQFGDVITTAVTAISSLSAQKNLAVVMDTEADLPAVEADRDRMVQVITNLLSNAVKFTDEGRITIRASRLLAPYDDAPMFVQNLQRSFTHGAWLWVRVQDTGLGIPENKLPDVFEKFKQVSTTLTERPSGTGLGLSICREIIQRHNGHIWVESEVGTGSTFHFVIPLQDVGIRESSPDALPVADVEAVATRPGVHILIVDDEEPIRNLLRQELTDAGYRLSEATDGIAALDYARATHPDLILLDIKIPRITGFDVVSVLKNDKATASIPILILSAITDRERGFRLGADGYLTKPWETGNLLNTIADVLARTESPADTLKET